MKQKLPLQPVKKVHCPKCGELMVKFYPNSSLNVGEGQQIPLCIKCLNKAR